MNFTDKKGCWTTSDRDLVLNYVKPNLYRYLFKEALPNLEYHLKSLTGLSEEELHLLKIIHFLLSPTVKDLLEELPNILRNLSHSTQKEVIECRGIIRGKIDWNLTYKERFSQGFNDPSLFICKPASKMYDLPENQLLKFILWKIRSLTESINLEVPEELILKEEWDNWNEIISSRHFKSKNYSKNIYFQNISMPRFIKPKTLQKAKTHRNKSYQKVAACYELYEDLFLIKDESRIRELIEKQILEPLNNDKLFEIYVLFKLLNVLEHRPGQLNIGLLKSNLRYTAEYVEDDNYVRIFYQQMPEEFSINSKNKDIFENYSLNVSLRRPDILLEIKKNGLKSYLIIEVKRSKSRDYIVDSVYKVLGYLYDFEKCFKNSENPQGILAVWDNITIKNRSKSLKQPVLILKRSNLEFGLNEVLKNILGSFDPDQVYPNLKNIDRILEYLDYFSNLDNEFYELIDKPPQMPFYSYSGEVMSFYKVLYDENMVRRCKWTDWREELRKYFDEPELIGDADLLTVQKLFITIIRSDRFCEGLMADMIDRKIFLKLLIRLEDIRDEMINIGS